MGKYQSKNINEELPTINKGRKETGREMFISYGECGKSLDSDSSIGNMPTTSRLLIELLNVLAHSSYLDYICNCFLIGKYLKLIGFHSIPPLKWHMLQSKMQHILTILFTVPAA